MENIRPRKSAQEITNWSIVFPNQANPNGYMFGGEVMAIMDITAVMAAKRFSETDVSTVSMEAVHFAKPIYVGDNIKTTAKVVMAGTTSMMVITEVFRDIGDNQLEKCVSAFLTFVAFDESHTPTQIPELVIAEEDKSLHEIALTVKKSATQRRNELHGI